MKNRILRGVRARNEPEAGVEAQTGIETVVRVLPMPALRTLKSSIACRRSNRHLYKAEAEVEIGQCSQLTTIETVASDSTNTQIKWWNVRRVENATQAEIENVNSFNLIIRTLIGHRYRGKNLIHLNDYKA